MYKNTLTVIYVVLITALLNGCMAFNNKQLTSQFQDIDVTVHEDERGLIITLPTVYFDFDSSNLKVSARDKIAQIATILNQERSSGRVIAVEGHTDNVGDPGYNLSLSTQRAGVVLKELAFSNVAQQRMSSAGKGETAPIAENSTAAGRQANRRVEIIVFNS